MSRDDFSSMPECTRATMVIWSPVCDAQVLERRLIRIAEDIKTAVTAEVDRIAAAGLPATSKTGWAQLTEAFPTADQLLGEIQVSNPGPQYHPHSLHALENACQ